MPKQYETTVYIGTVNGKPVRKHIVAGSQRELNEKKNIIKNDVLNKKDVNTKALFGVWAYKWLNEQTKGLNKGTVTQYESAIKHLNRYFEFVSLKAIKLSDFQTVINDFSIENQEAVVHQWIEQKGYLQAELTIEDLSRQLGTNRTYLSTFINSNYGVPFRQWIASLRIAEAKKMLCNTNLCEQDIAEAIGFVTVQSFIRNFTQIEGVSPSAYRRMVCTND